MDANVWPEPAGDLLKGQLVAEGQRWHLLHQPPTTLAAWEEYRTGLRARLRQLVGTWPEPPALDVREHGELRLDGYCIRKLSFQTRPGLYATANLYLPDGPGPFPAILGTHGHWSQGKLAARVAARGHTFAKEGFVVLIVDAFGSGERGTVPGEYEYHGKQIGASLLPVGETLLGMQVYDNMRGIDLLQGLDCVDADRIGVTGASGGGNQTMWVAAFDERIKAAVPVVSVGTFRSYVCNPNCICECLPNGLPLTEEWSVLALAAPAAMLILNALRDSNAAFQVSEMIRSYNGAREVYRLLGKEQQLAYRAIDLPHGYWPEMRSHALGWFKHWLKGEGNGWPCAIPEIPELPEADLKCFPDDQRPPDVKSVLAFAREKAKEVAAARVSNPDPDARRRELRDLLHLTPGAVRVARGPMVEGATGGQAWRKFTVEAMPGAILPCIELLPEGNREPARSVLALHPGGKAKLTDRPELQAWLGGGASVCLVDLRGTGETEWDNGRIAPGHDAARTALWLGRTMLGEWTEDIMALAQLFADAGVAVELAAWGEAGMAALCAAGLDRTVTRCELHGLPTSVVPNEGVPTPHMVAYVPGLLHWGDIADLRALPDCPVDVID
jgi:cephalosporin-C deacetylase-like acetyl esterase